MLSISGLWAARICADHFENVAIIEPEAWLDTDEGTSPIYDGNGVYIESRKKKTRARVEQYTAAHGQPRQPRIGSIPHLIHLFINRAESQFLLLTCSRLHHTGMNFRILAYRKLSQFSESRCTRFASFPRLRPSLTSPVSLTTCRFQRPYTQ